MANISVLFTSFANGKQRIKLVCAKFNAQFTNIKHSAHEILHKFERNSAQTLCKELPPIIKGNCSITFTGVEFCVIYIILVTSTSKND